MSDLKVIIDDPDGGLVVRHVVIAEVVDSDGVESLRWERSDGMADWTMLGLLRFVAASIEPRATEDDE